VFALHGVYLVALTLTLLPLSGTTSCKIQLISDDYDNVLAQDVTTLQQSAETLRSDKPHCRPAFKFAFLCSLLESWRQQGGVEKVARLGLASCWLYGTFGSVRVGRLSCDRRRPLGQSGWVLR
jgi:hypothetical protein